MKIKYHDAYHEKERDRHRHRYAEQQKRDPVISRRVRLRQSELDQLVADAQAQPGDVRPIKLNKRKKRLRLELELEEDIIAQAARSTLNKKK